MKKQTVLKKLLSSILVAIIVLGQFSGYRLVSKAATIDTTDLEAIYLSLSKTNDNGIGYANNAEEYIYAIKSTEDAAGTGEVSSSNLYCIKAEYSDTWNKQGYATRIKYNWQTAFNKNLGTTPSEEVNKLISGYIVNEENVNYFNEILWVLDNMYIPGESDLTEFLEQADIYYDDYDEGYIYLSKNGHDYTKDGIVGISNVYANTLTEDDIIAVQQAAIWYFTNCEDSDYDSTDTSSWLRYTTDGNNYVPFSSNKTGEAAREIFSYVLYNYLIDEALRATAELNDGEYELKNSTVKLWLSVTDGTDNKEQPVVEVHKVPEEEKEFDLSLRKAIVSVKDSKGNVKDIFNAYGDSAERKITVDASKLNTTENETTAVYNHRKDPVVVEKGDTVTYTITIYNEGQQAGYATIIKDKLPGSWNTGLRLENNQTTVTALRANNEEGNVYDVTYETETNTVILTMSENSSKKALTAFDEEKGITGFETVQIECKVMGKPDTVNSKVLTNIAYIAEDYNAETDTIQDRDSKPSEYPEYSNNALITDDIGYIGKTTNPTDFASLSNNETYYEGQQDDDDFEKIIIFPETFDLSLRKNITEVTDKNGNKVTIDDRTPKTDITNLDDVTTTTTTADYNHKKDAVVVENGSKVTYNLSLYNEGSIDGIATIVRDQLPSGLKLNINYFNEENGKYYITSLKGNVYEVNYNENSNLVTFTLDNAKTTSVYLLKAHKSGTELDKDIITLQCTVNSKADDDQKTYLTNIAYIYEAKQEDGTIVTTQTTGADADRDSQPHTYPYADKKAEDLTTIGSVGYTGSVEYTAEELANSNTYFEGQQDDDDFEKIVIFPETFDLSLRKDITEVTDEEGNKLTINDRTPQIDITQLDTGADTTTAKYNHRKDPVVVESGSKVIYNISLYNEGSIDGVATIVRDQLPSGLKLNISYFDRDGEKYYTTSLKGNVYEVSYDENNNLVTFTLDESKTVKYLSAHELGNKLDEDVITLQCTVNCKADDDQKTYLTNIAYIYEAKQEDGTIVTTQTTGADADRDSQPHTYPYANKTAEDLATIGNIGYTGSLTYTQEQLADSNTYFAGQQDDDDFEKLVMLPRTFDLKLIKFITQVNDEATENRVINVDTSKLNSTDKETTAQYILEKNPVPVKAGDFITYTLRVYNEGEYNGYATEISENIPEGLEFIVVTDGAIYSWDGHELKEITEEIKTSKMYETIIETNSNWGYNTESSIITTKALSEELIQRFEHGKDIDYAEVKVIFRVKEDVKQHITIRNEAAISEDKAVDNNGETIDVSDRDSTPDEWKKEDSEETYDEEGKWPIYKEDDEDYDNIITKAFDLSLRKEIVQINDALYTGRYANLLNRLEENANTIYDYYNVYSNKPKVKAGDKVVYSIRVYNEGDIDGYASLIVDTLPSGLEFIEYVEGDGSINDRYGWKLVEGTNNVYQTDYLSFEKDENKGTEKSTILKAYDGKGEASYQEIYIECRVKENVTKEDKLLNVAQIAEDSDEDGEPIKDKDSVPGISDDENKWKEEDDLDIEILELQEFDLSLRKFITQVKNGENIEEITTRIPQVTYNQETKQLVYTHTKDALIVHVGDTVIYTLRVYNEGDIDGYASEIKDDIPEYLEYLPEHITNQEYKWTMYDKDGNETEDVQKAVFIKTKYLSKENGEENLIKAFDANAEISEKNPDYKEVKVAFKVKDPNSTEYEIVNFAQISDDSDSNGDQIKDKDSEPDNGKDEPKEDDEDIEKVKVQYFDLSLLKFITKVIVNENGEQRIIETGNIGDENDIIPHVQIDRDNMYKTVVKFVYTIQIKNEGQIAGEATEITDYVPEGLIFLEEDNEFWTDEGNNVISTKQLKGTILQPGETAQVEVVLRWINGRDNLGPKTNVAEISEDHNEEGVPDRDSTPDNKEEGEDDIDDATVLLSPKQGGGIQALYINLIITFLVIILVGAILIKKFIL